MTYYSFVLLTAGIGRIMLPWFLLSILTSCSFMMKDSSPQSAKGSQYKINYKDSEWNEISREEKNRSDYVWENKKDGRIMLSNSFCNEFQDRPLDQLAEKTFQGISDYKVEKKDWTTFKNREAYQVEGKGKVDGVPVGLKLMNTRRNNCYFDFLAITPLKSAQDRPQDFAAFLDSVEFK